MRKGLGTLLTVAVLAGAYPALADSTKTGARSMPMLTDGGGVPDMPPAAAPAKKQQTKTTTTVVVEKTIVVEKPAASIPIVVTTKTQDVKKSLPAAAPVQTPVAPPAPILPELVKKSGATLADILARAYTDSPALRAEREVLRGQYENVALAQSNRRPVVTADGGIAWVNADTDPGTRDSFVSKDANITATQYLYRGGRTLAQIEQELSLSDAAIAAYESATQDVFLNVVTSAMDIQRDRATIELTEQDRTAVARALQSAQRGFDVGELTRTDVAQAQARLSGADAQLVASRADYSSALARFKQYAGQDGADLKIADDIKSIPVPANIDTARTTAESEHPSIRAAQDVERAAQHSIKVAQGALLPDVYAQGQAGKAWKPSTLLETQSSASVGLRASVPLYDGGASRAQIRQAKYTQMEKADRIEDAKRAVDQQVSTAWNDYQAALAQIDARNKQVDAAQLARDGVYKERQVGTRTVLDTLNADAEVLDAQVGLVEARRNAMVAGYALLAATGQLTGEKLGLFNVDSEKAVLQRTRNKWLGTNIEAAD
jgi:outer membrane protein